MEREGPTSDWQTSHCKKRMQERHILICGLAGGHYKQSSHFETMYNIIHQIKAYGLATKRGVKWFLKIFIELLCNAAVVNA